MSVVVWAALSVIIARQYVCNVRDSVGFWLPGVYQVVDSSALAMVYGLAALAIHIFLKFIGGAFVDAYSLPEQRKSG